jgi:hypothetical protein
VAAMGRGPSTFKKEDVTRAVRAAIAAGIQVQRVEIDPATGKIVIVTMTGKSQDVLDEATRANDFGDRS